MFDTEQWDCLILVVWKRELFYSARIRHNNRAIKASSSSCMMHHHHLLQCIESRNSAMHIWCTDRDVAINLCGLNITMGDSHGFYDLGCLGQWDQCVMSTMMGIQQWYTSWDRHAIICRGNPIIVHGGHNMIGMMHHHHGRWIIILMQQMIRSMWSMDHNHRNFISQSHDPRVVVMWCIMKSCPSHAFWSTIHGFITNLQHHTKSMHHKSTCYYDADPWHQSASDVIYAVWQMRLAQSIMDRWHPLFMIVQSTCKKWWDLFIMIVTIQISSVMLLTKIDLWIPWFIVRDDEIGITTMVQQSMCAEWWTNAVDHTIVVYRWDPHTSHEIRSTCNDHPQSCDRYDPHDGHGTDHKMATILWRKYNQYDGTIHVWGRAQSTGHDDKSDVHSDVIDELIGVLLTTRSGIIIVPCLFVMWSMLGIYRLCNLWIVKSMYHGWSHYPYK